jgi:hypothetical protein
VNPAQRVLHVTQQAGLAVHVSNRQISFRRKLNLISIFWPVWAKYRPMHGMVQNGTPAIESLRPPTPSTPVTLSSHVTVYR